MLLDQQPEISALKRFSFPGRINQLFIMCLAAFCYNDAIKIG